MQRDIFAKRLKSLRLSRGMTLQNLGDIVDCNRHNIGNLENARVSPSISMAIALADFFDVSLDYLIGRTDDPARPGIGDSNGEPAVPEPEKGKLIRMIENLADDDADKAISYVAFLRHMRRREDRKERMSKGEDAQAD